jgi:hypothetical protein
MEDKTEKKIKKSESKKYISLITGKVHCNEIFNLIEGKEIPKKITAPFIQSLLTNKTIKEV